METNYRIEEGHIYEYDDQIQYFLWKIKELKDQKYSDYEIENFEDDDIWRYCVDILLKEEVCNTNYKA